jgi:hypothetical protein
VYDSAIAELAHGWYGLLGWNDILNDTTQQGEEVRLKADAIPLKGRDQNWRLHTVASVSWSPARSYDRPIPSTCKSDKLKLSRTIGAGSNTSSLCVAYARERLTMVPSFFQFSSSGRYALPARNGAAGDREGGGEVYTR